MLGRNFLLKLRQTVYTPKIDVDICFNKVITPCESNIRECNENIFFYYNVKQRFGIDGHCIATVDDDDFVTFDIIIPDKMGFEVWFMLKLNKLNPKKPLFQKHIYVQTYLRSYCSPTKFYAIDGRLDIQDRVY